MNSLFTTIKKYLFVPFFFVFVDAVLILLCLYSSFLLRFNLNIPNVAIHEIKSISPFLVITLIVIFYFFRVYKMHWRFFSTEDLNKMFYLSLASPSLFWFALYFLSSNFLLIPRSIIIIFPILLFILLSGYRYVIRFLNEDSILNFNSSRKKVFLIVNQSISLSRLKHILTIPEFSVEGISCVGDSLVGLNILGFTVTKYSEFIDLHKNKKVNVVVVSEDSTHILEKEIYAQLQNFNFNFYVIPYQEIQNRFYSDPKNLRALNIEDLLGREENKFSTKQVQKKFLNKVIMISGAGGSIGSEISNQILALKPSLIICYDISEAALYSIQEKHLIKGTNIPILYYVGDVKNESRLRFLIKKHKPGYFFHAAAYKHVPMLESHNSFEALENNVLGTYTAAKICLNLEVENFILISSDKAVKSTNLMGATKRLSEIVCQLLSSNKNKKTKFTIVRFGNVLGSSGSVIPKFLKQINSGGPVTVTHPDITRYFMTIPEAAQLVIQASILTSESNMYLLDMGSPIKISDIARDLIRLSGFYDKEIKIIYTGLRPGEKLYEELYAHDERISPSIIDRINIVHSNQNFPFSLLNLLDWIQNARNYSAQRLKKELVFFVNDYIPNLRSKV
jgi:FlaA1/EpsC-like NDP-sugar epimerase